MIKFEMKSILSAIMILMLPALVTNAGVDSSVQAMPENSESGYVKDSYVITFKEPGNGIPVVVKKPDSANKGTEDVPFGEQSTNQTREEIADLINLKGEVLAIFDSINAIHVKMSAVEAERLRHDERVLRVEQDIISATVDNQSCLVSKEKRPYFDGQLLTLPTVESPDLNAVFQDVKFQMTEQGEWLLLDYNTAVEILPIESVELISTETFPSQIFLKVSGTFFNGCSQVGQVQHNLVDNLFEVSIYYQYPDGFLESEMACGAVLVPFNKIIPLPVYGLKAGAYQYRVNGGFQGIFHLVQDNVLE